MDGAEKRLQLFDACADDCIDVIGRCDFHDIDREPIETILAAITDIARPTAPDGSKSRAVGDIINAADLVLQCVRSEIGGLNAATGKPIVRKAACPHHFGSCFVIPRIIAQNQRIFHNGTEQGFRDAIGDFHMAAVRKVAFHRMHHDIGTAAGGLVIRQGHSQRRIHHRKTRSAKIRIVAALLVFFLFGDDGGIAHLTACCG